MRTLDQVIHWVGKAAAQPDADLDKDILHYLMMYRYLLRSQAQMCEECERARAEAESMESEDKDD